MDMIKIYLPILISLVALSIVLWDRVYPRYKLSSAINQIAVMRVPHNNIAPLLIRMLAADLSSGNPSDSALSISKQYPEIMDGAKENPEQLLKNALKLASKNKVGYNPPDEIVSLFTDDELFQIPLYVPLVISNQGNRIANITTITLVITKEGEENNKWLYWAVAELDEKLLVKRGKVPIKDGDRFSQSLGMVAVPPGSTIRLDPYFIPIKELDGVNIWPGNFKPDSYMVELRCYNDKNQLALSSQKVKLKLTEKVLIGAGQGNEVIDSVNATHHFKMALQE